MTYARCLGLGIGLKVPSLFVAAIMILTTAVDASDWPAFRGAMGDGTWAESTGLTAHRQIHLAKQWQVPIGSGYSGVVVANGEAFTMFSDETNDVLAAFHAATGKELWRYTIGETFAGRDGSHTGPLSTPAVAKGMVFGLSPRGRFFGLNAATGREQWSVDLTAEFGSKEPHYGFTTSPFVVDDVLILEVGGEKAAVAGFDPLTGKRMWTAGEDAVQYQSPVVVSAHGMGHTLVAAGDKKLIALAPRDGRVLWAYDHGGAGATGVASLSPVPAGGHRFFLAYKDDESTVVELTPGDGAVQSKTLWAGRSIRKSYNVPVYHDGHIYALASRFLTCVDVETGESKWRSRQPGDGFLALVDDHLVIATKKGGLHIAKATPEGYQERAGLELGDDLIWSPPAFADGSVFVRSLGTLTRVDIRAGAAGERRDDDQAGATGTKFARFLQDVRVSSDKKSVVDKFMASQRSFPIVEGRNVHFLYRGGAGDVAVAGDFIGARQERSMHRIAGTDLFYYTATLEPDARTNYMFIADYAGTIDPLNKNKTTTTVYKEEMEMSFAGGEMEMSWVAMSEWREPKHLAVSASGAKGRIETQKLDSKALEAEIPFDVYLPAGYNDSSIRYPVVYVHDGKTAMERGQWVTTLDNVVGKSVAPVIVVFFSANSRGKGPQYSEMVARELIPFVDETFRTIADSDHRASVGAGFAAFSALGVTVGNPDVVGKLGMQSLFMFASMRGAIDAYLKTADEQPLVIYQEWGEYDLRNPHEAWDLAETNRKFNKELRERGYKPVGGEVHDGTGWSSWRNRTDVMLASLFPM